MVSTLEFSAHDITKRFGRKPIFVPFTFSIAGGDIVALSGANGSGKSTLLKMIAGILSPSSGDCSWTKSGTVVDQDELAGHMGFVAPYLELYSELTAIEHIEFIAELKKKVIIPSDALSLLTHFGLSDTVAQSDRSVGKYSSGMRQRVALAMASVGDPEILLLDEPSSTLDEYGKEILFSHIREQASVGRIVVIATNDDSEKRLAHRVIDIQPL